MLPATVGMPTRQVPSRSMPRASGRCLSQGTCVKPLVDHVLGQLGIIAADGGDPPGTPQPDAPFADQQIEHGPDQRQEGDEEHPRQGNAAGRPPHDHPQRYPQHDRHVQRGSAAWRVERTWGISARIAHGRAIAAQIAILTRSTSEGNSSPGPPPALHRAAHTYISRSTINILRFFCSRRQILT